MAQVTTKIPDGKGGWTEVTGEQFVPTKTANTQKQQAAMAAESTKRLVAYAESLNAFENRLAADDDATPEERVFAIAFYVVTMRNKFPAAMGGPAKFDEIAAQAQEYYDSLP